MSTARRCKEQRSAAVLQPDDKGYAGGCSTAHGYPLPHAPRRGLLATALAKFPEQTRAFVRSSNLPADVIKLYIRKARDSFRTRTVEAL